MLQRQCIPRKQPSQTGLRRKITALHRFLSPSVFLCITHEKPSMHQFLHILQGFQCMRVFPPRHPSRPVIPMNTCPLRLTAAAGTEFAGAFLMVLHHRTTGQSLQQYAVNLLYAASLHQGFPHCARFFTAANIYCLNPFQFQCG